jgi:hypothetical protein
MTTPNTNTPAAIAADQLAGLCKPRVAWVLLIEVGARIRSSWRFGTMDC